MDSSTFKSGIRRPVETDETMACLRDLLLPRTAVRELIRDDVELLCDEQSSATDAVLAHLIQSANEADTGMYRDLTAQLAPARMVGTVSEASRSAAACVPCVSFLVCGGQPIQALLFQGPKNCVRFGDKCEKCLVSQHICVRSSCAT
jgi:hypothetical protein